MHFSLSSQWQHWYFVVKDIEPSTVFHPSNSAAYIYSSKTLTRSIHKIIPADFFLGQIKYQLYWWISWKGPTASEIWFYHVTWSMSKHCPRVPFSCHKQQSQKCLPPLRLCHCPPSTQTASSIFQPYCDNLVIIQVNVCWILSSLFSLNLQKHACFISLAPLRLYIWLRIGWVWFVKARSCQSTHACQG